MFVPQLGPNVEDPDLGVAAVVTAGAQREQERAASETDCGGG
jgi:hypothetical protein